MRALPLILAAALASLPALAQNNPRIPKPGPSPTSGSDAGPFSGLPDNVPPAPRVFLTDREVQPSPANDALPNVNLRDTATVQSLTERDLDRAQREHQEAAAQMNARPAPIAGAFTGQTDERSR